MGPPGGGRNSITGRFTRHLNLISIESFDDNTMTKIFTSLVDWHFGKGFDAIFTRLGKVSTCHTTGDICTYDQCSSWALLGEVPFCLLNWWVSPISVEVVS